MISSPSRYTIQSTHKDNFHGGQLSPERTACHREQPFLGSLDYPTPNNIRSTSPVTSAYGPSLQAPSYGPIVENGRVGNGDFPSSVCSELAPQPALRHELAGHDSSAAVVTDRDGFVVARSLDPEGLDGFEVSGFRTALGSGG